MRFKQFNYEILKNRMLLGGCDMKCIVENEGYCLKPSIYCDLCKYNVRNENYKVVRKYRQ